ncbi:uncharacterized protein LOC144560375 [Carex rostrata]
MDHKSKLQKKKSANNLELIQELKNELLLAHAESDAKDELLAKQAKVAKEAVSGWQKAESENSALKQQLKNLSHQNIQIEQNLAKLTAETKNHVSNQEEKIKSLEEKLTEANDKVAILNIENKNIYAILETKETIIKEMNESSDKASITEMKVRLDATEKENSNLKYELHMAQKELEIRNKERDYNIKTAEAAYKSQLESLKKVSKLETECNKLRMMLRKRLPGPGAVAKMRNEIKNLGINSNNSTETRRKSSTPLADKLHVIEEENRVLKETLARKNEDTMSCVTESWATTFISELDHFKEEKVEGLNSDFGFEEDQFQNYPGWLKDIVRVIIKHHYVIQMSVNSIIEEVLVALKKTGFYTEGEKEVEKCTVALEIMDIPDKTSVVPERSNLSAIEENNLPKETCESAPKNVEVTNKPSEEVESQGSNDPDLEANKVINGETNGIEKECDKEVEGEIGERDDDLKLEEGNNEKELLKGADELKVDSFKDAKKSFELESETKLESDDTKGEREQLETDSDTEEASKKLAECQEEIQNISKQLEAMSEPKNSSISDEKDNSVLTLESDQRSCSLYQILAADSVQKANSNENGADLIIKVPENDVPVQLLVPKKQKEVGMFSRIFFGRKRREIKPERET